MLLSNKGKGRLTDPLDIPQQLYNNPYIAPRYYEYNNLKAATEVAASRQLTRSGTRVYQIERLGKRVSFCVGRIEEILQTYILDPDECGGSFITLMEYIYGGELCPLTFDIDWITPQYMQISTMQATMKEIVKALV